MSEPHHEPEDRFNALAGSMARILREMEDADDLKDAQQALDEPGDDISAEQVWAELGLS
jgi:hypothetical protein